MNPNDHSGSKATGTPSYLMPFHEGATPSAANDQAQAQAQDEKLRIKIAVPFDYHTPFHKVVDEIASMGVEVQQAHSDARAIRGSCTPEVLAKINRMGLPASEEQKLTWKV